VEEAIVEVEAGAEEGVALVIEAGVEEDFQEEEDEVSSTTPQKLKSLRN
jgi:hypothetical protein